MSKGMSRFYSFILVILLTAGTIFTAANIDVLREVFGGKPLHTQEEFAEQTNYVEQLLAQVNAISAQKNAIQINFTETQQQLAATTAAKEEAEASLTASQTALTEKQSELTEAQNNLAATTTQLTEVTAQRDSALTAKESAETALATAQSTIAQKQSELTEAQNGIDNLTGQLNAAQQAHATAVAAKETAESNLVTAQNLLAEKLNELNNAQGDIEDLLIEVAHAESQRNLAILAKEEAEASVAPLELALAEKQSELSAAQNSIDTLTTQLNSAEAHRLAAVAALETAEENAAYYQDEYERMTVDYELALDHVDSLMLQVETLEGEVLTLNTIIEDLLSDKEELQQTITSMGLGLSSLQADLEGLQLEYNEMETYVMEVIAPELERLENEIQQLQNDVDEAYNRGLVDGANGHTALYFTNKVTIDYINDELPAFSYTSSRIAPKIEDETALANLLHMQLISELNYSIHYGGRYLVKSFTLGYVDHNDDYERGEFIHKGIGIPSLFSWQEGKHFIMTVELFDTQGAPSSNGGFEFNDEILDNMLLNSSEYVGIFMEEYIITNVSLQDYENFTMPYATKEYEGYSFLGWREIDNGLWSYEGYFGPVFIEDEWGYSILNDDTYRHIDSYYLDNGFYKAGLTHEFSYAEIRYFAPVYINNDITFSANGTSFPLPSPLTKEQTYYLSGGYGLYNYFLVESDGKDVSFYIDLHTNDIIYNGVNYGSELILETFSWSNETDYMSFNRTFKIVGNTLFYKLDNLDTNMSNFGSYQVLRNVVRFKTYNYVNIPV